MQIITAFALIYVVLILFDRLVFVEYLVLYILKEFIKMNLNYGITSAGLNWSPYLKTV